MIRRRFNLMPFVVLFGGALAWADSVPESPHTPFLFNRTEAPADVRMTWVLRRIPCKTTPEMLADTLGPSDLDDPRAVTLDSGEVVTLNGPSAAGVCPDPIRRPSMPDQDCRAAILETAGAAPVLMVAPQSWGVPGDSYFCTPGPSTASKCAPKLDPADDGGDEALALVSRDDGTLAFEVSKPNGPVDRTIRIGGVDPAAIAARAATPDGCRQTRDAYRALTQSTACASNADCQVLAGISIPGEVTACKLLVNKSVTPEAAQAVVSQWTDGMCANGASYCPSPLGVVCRAGACAELCGGVPVPSCDTPCNNWASEANGICSVYFAPCSGSGENCHPVCTDAQLQRCVCRNNTVVCEPRPLVDPSCPIPCRQ
jgi:hypothetical protein